MLTKRQMVIEYINAIEANDERNRKIEEGLNLLCEGSVPSVIDCITYRLSVFYDTLLIQVLGDVVFDWINWYLYECNSPRQVIINEVEYTIDSPEMLFDLCIDPPTDEKD